MFRKLGSHIRGNVVGYIALFVALASGSAYAVNTISSTDIVDGQVKTADLGSGAVTNGKLAGDARTRAFSYVVANSNDAASARHVVVDLAGLRVAVNCAPADLLAPDLCLHQEHRKHGGAGERRSGIPVPQAHF